MTSERGMVALLTRFSPEMVTQNLRAMDMDIIHDVQLFNCLY